MAPGSAPSASLPSLSREEPQRGIACPACHQLMDTHPYYGPGNVVINDCGGCGLVWLDFGELDRILSWRSGQGAPPVATGGVSFSRPTGQGSKTLLRGA